MPTVQSFASIIHGRRAADYLLANAIMARVVMSGSIDRPGGCTVEVLDEKSAERARELLREWADQGLYAPDPGWEDQTLPDLSRLPPETQASCPRCGDDLPLDATRRACPHCRAEVDVVEILVARLGPDTLTVCYPQETSDIPEEFVQSAEIACPACGYSLKGLPLSGACPECGGAYSKVEILRRGSA